MPRYPIDRATNFIVEEESWTVVEYDHTSVPGVIYLSLTENKINSIYDDVKNNIADLDKLANYKLSVPDLVQTFKINEPIIPKFTLMKNGKVCKEEVGYKTTDKKKARFINNVLTAVGVGSVDIIIFLIKYPDISVTLTVEIADKEQEFSAYINGNDFIRLDRSETYNLIGVSEIIGPVNFYLESTILASIKSYTENQCTILANNKNKLGKIKLFAEYNGNRYEKEITIKPLW